MLLKASITVIVCGVAGAFLMILAYMLPTEPIKANVQRGTAIYNILGAMPEIVDNYPTTRLDLQTDGLMLENAVCPVKNVVRDAMSVPAVSINGDNYSVNSVLDYVNDVKGKEQLISIYPRYWHGYLVILKPLLYLFDFSDVEIMNMILQISLWILVTAEFVKKGLKEYLPALIAFAAVMHPTELTLSFQITDCFLITMVAVIYLLQKENYLKENVARIYIYFLVIGIITSYIDFLTYPLVTLGIPLALWIILKTPDMRIIRNLIDVIKCSLYWLLGYAGMWSMKWLIGTVILRKNIFDDAIGAVNDRISSGAYSGEKFTRIDAVKINIGSLMKWPYLIVSILVILWIITDMKKRRNKKSINGIRIKLNLSDGKGIPLLIISFYPIIWFFVASNHSYYHPRLAFRELAITAFGLTALIINMVRDNSSI
jgi:hypothetical protein